MLPLHCCTVAFKKKQKFESGMHVDYANLYINRSSFVSNERRRQTFIVHVRLNSGASLYLSSNPGQSQHMSLEMAEKMVPIDGEGQKKRVVRWHSDGLAASV